MKFLTATKLSKDSLKVCGIHYKHLCHRCPIRPACTSSIGYGQKALDQWQERVNQEAKQYIEENRDE